MGTRSLTFIHDGDNAKPFVCMYRQYDGYPSGHGKELAEFLKPIRMVNCLGSDSKHVANGAGCLAAQIVAHFKDGPGRIYLKSASDKDCWQDYEYNVYADENIGIRVKCFAVGSRKELLFEGDVDAFGEFCNAEDD